MKRRDIHYEIETWDEWWRGLPPELQKKLDEVFKRLANDYEDNNSGRQGF
jgi:hypothetical protein